jgi:hypothetical protein
MKIEGYTPRQYVMASTITFLSNMHRTVDRERRFNDTDLTPAQTVQVKKEIAKQHNQLLDRAGLDGTHIELY